MTRPSRMDMYRALPANRLKDAGGMFMRQDTLRIPRNVPYVVDNLWEWMRPSAMPSRRHAVYASPTPALALENASSQRGRGEDYVACRVHVEPERIRIAQLQIKDARAHADIAAFAGFVDDFSQELTQASIEERQLYAPLFTPGLGRHDLEALRSSSPMVVAACRYALDHFTLWNSASSVPAHHEGELFFELEEGAEYRLVPVQPDAPGGSHAEPAWPSD